MTRESCSSTLVHLSFYHKNIPPEKDHGGRSARDITKTVYPRISATLPTVFPSLGGLMSPWAKERTTTCGTRPQNFMSFSAQHRVLKTTWEQNWAQLDPVPSDAEAKRIIAT